ncbi:apolipoprotein M-like [Chanodichthys erythropterus]|uniref:apolipoprotein M-like n=1 Tax=Chanodichthys erythropterus TaxID=933992 RepID=UPI00351E3175
MLMNTSWSAVGSLMGLFYFWMQVMVPCLPPAPLSISHLNTDEYMGSWHLVAVSVWDEHDLRNYKYVDNSILHIEKGDNDTLNVTEFYSILGWCQKNAWTYDTSILEPFMLRSDMDAFALVWDGKFVNCPSCIIMLHVDRKNKIRSTMLFDRGEKTPDEVIQKFKSKMECLYMKDFLKLPREKAQCQIEAAA